MTVPAAIEAVFARAMPIADAVLWEGYVLYPYRRSAAKNRIRFQWGVVGPAELPEMASEVLVEAGRVDRIWIRVRFLHLHRRDDGWDEAVTVDRDLELSLTSPGLMMPIDMAGGRVDDGMAEALSGSLRVTTTTDGDEIRVSARVENPTRGEPLAREDALLHSFIGCHLLFAAEADAFVSLLEPPEPAIGAASRCTQHRCWPVLVGPAPRRDLVLASPVILYDYPAVAPESRGDFFDGTEIDEMLTLRVQTLTDEEKAEARSTDPRAAAIIDRCDTLPDGELASLHGAHRTVVGGEPVDPMPEWSDPGPGVVIVAGVAVRRGSKVVLRPSKRADIHDMFVAGRTATVAEVVNDVDGEVHIAVLIDDDPAAELFDAHGRFRYFAPDEVEPLQLSRSLETRSLDSAWSLALPSAVPTSTRVLVAGVGNIFNSDDGFGSAVASELLDRELPTGATVVDYGIRGVHLAFDLAEGVETLILVDTVPDAGGGPGSIAVIEAERGSFGTAALDAHDLDPGSVIRTLGGFGGELPRTLVVGCQPETVEDGIGLSAAVAAAVPVAADTVLQLLREELRGSR